MKHYTAILSTAVMVIIPLLLLSQETNKTSKTPRTKEILLGKTDKASLTQNPFSKWFSPNYNAYSLDFETLKTLEAPLKNFTIVAFMGTWCGDSRREIPRFYKLLEAINYPMANFLVFGVDNARDRYKKSPNGEEEGLDIKRVPTFIVYKNGTEINRIVESPIVSLEKDLKEIINGTTYIPNYAH